MYGHLTVLADQERVALFALLCRPRQLFKEATTWIDDQGVIWTGTRVGSLGVGLSWLGPGWLFDPLAQRDRQEEYASRLRAMRECVREYEANCGAADWAERRLGHWLADVGVRLRAHAERLLWAIHTAVWQAQNSQLCLSDQWLGDLLWGTAARPRHWRGGLMGALRGLSLFHVAQWAGEAPPAFGSGTALLNHVGDLRGEDDDQCDEYCLDHQVRRHHHVLVEIGPEFLGILEQFGQFDPESGLRAYDFPRDGKGPSLRKVGKTGRVVSVFVPARLGDPAMCARLTADQHRLMQAILRETTRAKRKSPKKEPSRPEVFSGNSICSFHGKKSLPCNLLDPAVQYVGFNGNGCRPGTGYLLGAKGWLGKAGYSIDVVDAFLDDLAAVAELLSLVVIGVDRMNRFFALEAIRTLGATPAGRRDRERLHVRVYTAADYLERWSAIFQGAVPKATALTPLVEDIARVMASMKRKNISQRRLAIGIKTDHSFLNKLLKGDKPWPKELLKKVQRWLDKQPESRPRPRSTHRRSQRKKPKSKDDSLLSLALGLLRRGWSVVPQLPGAKKACVKWKPYQDRLPTEEEWREWAGRWPNAGLALVLGPVSGIFVVDVDGEEAHLVLLKRLGKEPLAPKVLSGSGKPYRYHLYFKCPDVPTKAKQTPWHPKLEFRGHRGIVVIPPSLHKSGNKYVWVKGRSPDDMDLPELPPQVLEALKPVPMKKPSPKTPHQRKLSVTGVEASKRTLEFLSGEWSEGPNWNDKMFNAACDLSGRGMSLEKAEPLLLAGAMPWNQGEMESAQRTIQSAYSQPRKPGRL